MEHSQREPEHEAFGLEPPPTQREVSRMMVVTAVRTLTEYVHVAETVEQVCGKCFDGQSEEKRSEAADAGAIPVIVDCMARHADNAVTQEKCILALGNICCGTEAAGLLRKQIAADCGAIGAIVKAMRTHVSATAVQENGSATLGNIASHVDAEGVSRKAKAVEEGALEAVVTGMLAHMSLDTVQAFGSFAIANLTRARGTIESEALGADDGGAGRKQQAIDAGALDAVVKGMKAHPTDSSVQQHGARALANMTFSNDAGRKRAVEAGALPEWLDGAVTAR